MKINAKAPRNVYDNKSDIEAPFTQFNNGALLCFPRIFVRLEQAEFFVHENRACLQPLLWEARNGLR